MSQQRRDPNAARNKIFNKTYLYSMPALYRYSAKFNEVVGQISTGDPVEDRKLMNEPVHLGGTIMDILKLFRDGVPVTMSNAKDLPDIYDTLVEHMNNWIEYIQFDPNVKNAPMESLQLMQEYTEAIFAQVKGFRPQTKRPPTMVKRTSMLFGGMSREQQAAQTPQTPAENKPVPLLDRLEHLLSQRNQ